ncbi:DUF6541 family protein [Mycetocola zhujimingii]|uniref:DUF6541 family protein n=1 Tax=Mycetocola zhujimingii TaxID=2079792 RepID=UPI000D3A807B|nr:DUF6541 family protein [Mycetocola zhujimingii]AWB85794.1 hypothetical protein C3E77_03625 [Mycetocola zhujimingii]
MALIPSILIGIAVLTVPGWSIARLAGARGFLAAAGGVPVSVGIVAVAAILAPLAQIPWSIWPVVALWAVLAIIVGATRLVLRRRAPKAPRESNAGGRTLLHGVLGVAIGGVLTAMTIAQAVGSPDNFSLRFDNVFHLNAVRYALDTSNASSFSIGGVTSAGSPPAFYPAGWHDLATLIAQLGGGTIPQSVNALNVAIAVAAWVGGAVLLGQLLTRHTLAGSITGAIAASAFPAFPILMLEWGVLYSNYLAFALLPTMVALLVLLLKVRGVYPLATQPLAGVLLVAGLPGLALAHPSGAITLGLFFAVTFVLQVASWLLSRPSGSHSPRGTAVGVASIVAVLIVTVAVWLKARPSLDVAPWHKVQSTGQAIGEVLTNSPMQRPFSLLVSVAVILGLFILIKRREYAFPLMAAATTVLFVASSAFADGALREFIAGPYYQDSYRLASLTAVTALPLAIVGALAAFERLVHILSRAVRGRTGDAGETPGWLKPVAALTAALIAIIGTQFGGMQRTALEARPAYEITDASELVDSDEYELMMKLPDLVPEDAILLVNPGTGAAYAYALTGIPVTATHMFYESSDAEKALRKRLNRAATNPAVTGQVCEAVDELGGDVYVLDFDDPADLPEFSGLEDLDSPVVEVVEQVGDDRLLRISLCG